VTGATCTATDAGCTCPLPSATGTALDVLTTLGDEFTVSGVVGVFTPPTGDARTPPPQHEIDIPGRTKTGSGKVVAPTVVANGALFGFNGTGYATYENMLVQLQPASPFTISAPNQFGDFSGAGANFAGIYRFVYGNGGTFPAAASTWTSIAGIAQPAFGGGLAPRLMADFTP
jgi:hypothetical protein